MENNLKTVLIVEDEKLMAKALELKFNEGCPEHNFKFCSRVVYGGEEALDILDKENFDLIILDLMMPRIDGFEVLAKMISKKNYTPVIALSNLGQEEDIERAKELGVKKYLIKSDITLHQVIECVEEVLRN